VRAALLFTVALVTVLGGGCGTFEVRSSEGIGLSETEALEVVKSLEYGRGEAYLGPHVHLVSKRGIELALLFYESASLVKG